MAPIKKSKSLTKRFTNEASPDIYVPNSSKTKQRKKKLTDKLGPQWTRGELQRFYDAYRKYGDQWKKVAAAVRNNRSFDMVEALFYMNRAYLSLPEGTASVAGLIAMMTDHYSVIEESESEEEEEDDDVSEVRRKYQKRKRSTILCSDAREEVIPPHSFTDTEGCLTFLKQRKAYAKRQCASKKRTPRFPVPITDNRDDREGSNPSNKRAKRQQDADDDYEGHILAIAMAASKRPEHNDTTPIRPGKKQSQAKEAQSTYKDSSMFENGGRVSLDRRHIKGPSDRDDALLLDMEVSRKGKNLRYEESEGNDSDDSGDACTANEGLGAKSLKGMVDVEASQGKRNKKLCYRDDELEALEALTGLASVHLNGLKESAAQLEKERIANNMDEKSNVPETTSRSHHREKPNQGGPKDILLHEISAADNRNPESTQASIDGNSVSIREFSRRKRKPKMLDGESPTDNISMYTKESADGDNMKTVIKIRRPSQGPPKLQKTAKTSEESSSSTGQDAVEPATQGSGMGPATLPQKTPNRRKISLKKILQERAKPSETTHGKPHIYELPENDELLKGKVSSFLSNPLARRRCIYEWFYSAIDYPWFAKMEFIDYLNHVGLAHVPRLTRLEWSVIKSSLGRPRRFSERFIQEEQDKLKQYRESVRNHYTEYRTGAKEGLPTDLARPLSVGNRVIAIHPRTRELRDGKILTVDHDKCKVLFDDSGDELVMDIDCMPLNPLEYMPEALRRQVETCLPISKEVELNKHPNSDASVVLSPSVLDNVSFPNPPAKQDDMCKPVITDQPPITRNTKEREAKIQRALMLQNALHEKEMEPEVVGIVNNSKSIAQAMVDEAMKAAYSLNKKEDARNTVQQALSSIGEHQALDNSITHSMKYQEHTNGSLDNDESRSPSNTAEPMINGFSSEDESRKNETKMSSELISSCVATWLMIQMCAEKQYPPADVAEVMDTAVSNLQPRCPQNMPIYREIQTCMGWIKTQIMALVRT